MPAELYARAPARVCVYKIQVLLSSKSTGGEKREKGK